MLKDRIIQSVYYQSRPYTLHITPKDMYLLAFSLLFTNSGDKTIFGFCLQCRHADDKLIKVSGIQGYEKYLKRKRKDVEEIKKIRNLDE